MKHLSEEDRAWLQANGKEKRVMQNEVVLTKGEITQEIYIIIRGLFIVFSETGEQFSTVGPGDIIGVMTFLTEKAVSLPVAATEPDSILFAIPRKVIAAHLMKDLNFAARFYRAIATLVSERVTNWFSPFMIQAKTKSHKDISSNLPLGPVPLFSHDKPDFDLIHTKLESSPSLSSIFKQMQEGNYDDNALIERERHLSVATVSAESIKLLWDVAMEENVCDLDKRIIKHKPSLTAAEKRLILPDFQIQKTITILIEDKFVLCSSIGDFKIQHKLLNKIALFLGLPHSSFNSYINPAVFVPEVQLGLLRGMVSTFFAPRRFTQLNLVSLITTSHDQTKDVAVSLSPFESLILPSDAFPGIVKKFAERAYPYLPFKLQSHDETK